MVQYLANKASLLGTTMQCMVYMKNKQNGIFRPKDIFKSCLCKAVKRQTLHIGVASKGVICLNNGHKGYSMDYIPCHLCSPWVPSPHSGLVILEILEWTYFEHCLDTHISNLGENSCAHFKDTPFLLQTL